MVKIVVAGAINWDINLFVKRFPKVGEEVAVDRITRVAGGRRPMWRWPSPGFWAQVVWL